jgi:hypothetical protein
VLSVNINRAVVEDSHNLCSIVASANKGITEAAHNQLREVGIVPALVSAHVLTLTQVLGESLPRVLRIRSCRVRCTVDQTGDPADVSKTA